MALAQMRERQKLIIWITAILIIPIFAFTFGTGVGRSQRGGDTPVIRLTGAADRVITVGEAETFGRAYRALHGQPIPLDRDGLSFMARLFYYDAMATQAGVKVSDAEVGWLIRDRFPTFVDEKTETFDKKAFRDHLRERYGLEAVEVTNAVRTLLRIQRFTRLLDQTAIASPSEAYVLWAAREMEVAYDRVAMTVDKLTDAARKMIPDMDAAIQTYLQEHAEDRDFLAPGRWRLEYLISPYASWTDVPPPDEEQLRRHYEAHSHDYESQTFEEARPALREAVQRELQKSRAQRLMNRVDAALARLAAQEGVVDAERLLESDAYLARQAEVGHLKVGVSNEALLTPEDLEVHDTIGDCPELGELLRDLNDIEDAAERTSRIEALKTIYNARIEGGPRGQRPENLANDVGVFKIRILAYEPGARRDPAKDAEFRELLETRIVRERARTVAEQMIGTLRKRVLEGETEGVELESKTGGFYEVRGEAPALIQPETVVGEPTEVSPTGDGFEFFVLRGRNVPTFAEFNSLPAEERSRYRDWAVAQLRQRMYQSGQRQRLWDRRIGSEVEILLRPEPEHEHTP